VFALAAGLAWLSTRVALAIVAALTLIPATGSSYRARHRLSRQA
jgi:hypothetical protein